MNGATGRRAHTTLLLAFVLLAGAGCRSAAGAREVHRNLEYAQVEGRRLKLDLYLPETAGPAPLVVWIHGGGWFAGGKGSVPLRGLVGEGFAVASINYRLTHASPFPAQIHDCKAAVRWLRAHADRFGLDGGRIGVAGESAGAHLAALLGTTAGDPRLDGRVGQHLDQPTDVAAVCDLYGPADLAAYARYDAAAGPLSLIRGLLGGPLREKQELAALASPINHVDASDPPFLIVHGTRDPLVPIAQSRQLHARLRAAGVSSELIERRGGGHGLGLFGRDETKRRIARFFADNL